MDDFVRYDKIKWSGDLKVALQRGNYAEFDEVKVRNASYRPFCRRYLYFDRLLINSIYLFPSFFPTPETEGENRVIWIKVGSDWPMFCLMSNHICDLLPQGGSQCFPFYTYDEDGGDRRENVTDWALERFRKRYKDKNITKWDVFHYVYAVLHHAGYRERFRDSLKRELPRVPFMKDFRTFAKAGEALAGLHVGYEAVEEWPLDWVEDPAEPVSWRVEKMRLSKDKTELRVNDWLTLAGIPAEAFDYRLGNRSALDWVIDQYQVKTDKRSGAVSDPNRRDDPEYVVRLAARVVRVSVETARIVRGLPKE